MILSWIIPLGLPALALVTKNLETAILLIPLGVSISIGLQVWKEVSREKVEAEVWVTPDEIATGYGRLVAEAHRECLFTWVANYPENRADAHLAAEASLLNAKQSNFKMIRLVGYDVPYWSKGRFETHLDERSKLRSVGKYECYRADLGSGVELGYVDYKATGGEGEYKAAINFMLSDGTPYFAIVFDSALGKRHERITQAIRTLFMYEYRRATENQVRATHLGSGGGASA